MSVSAAQFIEGLTRSGIYSPDEVTALLDSLPSAILQNTTELTRELVQRRALTRYQASALLQGKPNGLVLGTYVILDRLGVGGMGMVFRARHRRMERIVALKLLPPRATQSTQSLQRFHREVKAAGKLNHPNIVAALDADEAKGVHYLVMEYVDGVDLAAYVTRRGPLPVREAVDYVVQAAQGLQYAHNNGIVHRDIKPSNLMIDKSGSLKILDMGVARFDSQIEPEPTLQDWNVLDVSDTPSKEPLTQSGTIVGTADYMAPEQARDVLHADSRSDIYSLGCTFFYLLIGRPMYNGESILEKLMAHQNEPIPVLREFCPGVSEGVENVFRSMVRKRPEERMTAMTDVIASFSRCINEGLWVEPRRATGNTVNIKPNGTRAETPEPRPAVPAKPTDKRGNPEPGPRVTNRARPARPRSRGKKDGLSTTFLVLLMGGATALAALVIGLIVVAKELQKPSATEKKVDQANKEITVEVREIRPDPPVAGKPLTILLKGVHPKKTGLSYRYKIGTEGKWQVSNAKVSLVIKEPGSVEIFFSAMDTMGNMSRVISQKWEVEEGNPGGSPARREHQIEPQAPKSSLFSPSPSRDATIDLTIEPPDAKITVVQENIAEVIGVGKQRVLRLFADASPGIATITLDVEKEGYVTRRFEVHLAEPNQMYAIQLERQAPSRLELVGHEGAVRAMAVDGTGKKLVSAGEDGSVRLWDLVTGAELRQFGPQRLPIVAVAFSPQNDKICFACADGRAWIWGIDDEKEMTRLIGHQGIIRAISFSTDGQYVLTASTDQFIHVWNIKLGLGQVVHRWHVKMSSIGHLYCLPDGRHLVTASKDSRENLRYWIVANGDEIPRFKGADKPVTAFAATRDGQRFLVGRADGKLAWWSVAGGREVVAWNAHEGTVQAVAVSPDGRWILSAGADGFVKLWESDTQRELERYPAQGGLSTAVAFTPNYQRALYANADGTIRCWTPR